jgi:hypothetical protein
VCRIRVETSPINLNLSIIVVCQEPRQELHQRLFPLAAGRKLIRAFFEERTELRREQFARDAVAVGVPMPVADVPVKAVEENLMLFRVLLSAGASMMTGKSSRSPSDLSRRSG